MMFSDGANGYKLQNFRNAKHGIYVFKEKMNRDAKWTIKWSANALPGKEFGTYEELKIAVDKRIK